jgi:hypothetical protein
MRQVGFFATAALILGGLIAIAVGLLSLGDLKRYLKIRRM